MYRVITVHDYFIDEEDRTLYFVTKSGEFSKPFWLTQKQVPNHDHNEKEANERIHYDKSCALQCDKKCRTVGLLLVTFQCGVILTFRELYGSESLT